MISNHTCKVLIKCVEWNKITRKNRYSLLRTSNNNFTVNKYRIISPGHRSVFSDLHIIYHVLIINVSEQSLRLFFDHSIFPITRFSALFGQISFCVNSKSLIDNKVGTSWSTNGLLPKKRVVVSGRIHKCMFFSM